MDALSDVLQVAQLTGGVFLHAEFTAPWCIEVRMTAAQCAPYLGPAAHLIPYHYVVEGELHAALEDGESCRLGTGDLILFPSNGAHFMGSDLDLPPTRAGGLIVPSENGGLHSIRHGKGGAPTRMICGYLGCDSTQGNPVILALPALMRLRVDDVGPADWIRSSFQYAANEIAAGRPGSATVLAKLSELLFVEAVRRYVEGLPANRSGWLAGLRDPAVSRALALMHGDVARHWSVDELGREAGLSRSALAERFTRLIGVAPMQYLGQWRMQLAAGHLKKTNASLAQIAKQVGYDTEAAFSRAFKKTFGQAPATWRRSAT